MWNGIWITCFVLCVSSQFNQPWLLMVMMWNSHSKYMWSPYFNELFLCIYNNWGLGVGRAWTMRDMILFLGLKFESLSSYLGQVVYECFYNFKFVLLVCVCWMLDAHIMLLMHCPSIPMHVDLVAMFPPFLCMFLKEVTVLNIQPFVEDKMFHFIFTLIYDV